MSNLKYFLLLPVVILVVIYFPTNHFFINQYDDSYITYRYAINLAQGNGIVFNIGEKTDSASSFLYTVILSILYLLGLKDLELMGGGIGFVSLYLVCLYVFKIAEYLTSNKAISVFVAVLCGLNGFLSGWTLSGMETLLWTLTVVMSIYFFVTNANAFVTALAVASSVLMRFEGILLILPYV